MKNLVIRTGVSLVVGLLLGAAGAVAQTPMAGTNIGQRINPDDARMVARGGWGMAIADSTHPGFKNTASLSYLRHFVLKYTGYGELAESETEAGSRRMSGVYSPGLQFALPVIKSRLALTAGFSMTGSTRWDAQRDTSYALADSFTNGGVSLTREGTRFKVPLGIGWRVFGGLSISGAANLESGSILENVNEGFTAPRVDPNLKETKDLFRGTSYTLGMLWKPFDRLQLGASWTPAHNLKVDRQVTAVGVTARHKETWDMGMPDEYMAGFQLRFTNRWQIGADAQYMPFSEFSGNDAWAAEMQDEYTLGIGLEHLKANERHGGLGNLPLRLGANYHRWAYGLGGEPLDEYTVSIGTGFAFAQELGQLDVSFSYGIIGEVEKNGVESEVYRLGISITGLEAWW